MNYLMTSSSTSFQKENYSRRKKSDWDIWQHKLLLQVLTAHVCCHPSSLWWCMIMFFNDCSSFLTLPCSWLDVMHVRQVLNSICTKFSHKFLNVISTFCIMWCMVGLWTVGPILIFLKSVIYKKTNKKICGKTTAEGLIANKLLTLCTKCWLTLHSCYICWDCRGHAEKCSPKIVLFWCLFNSNQNRNTKRTNQALINELFFL